VAWVASLIGVPAGVVAIDGKTVRRSGGKAGKGASHMVSAFAASQRLVPGPVKVAEKSNEIVAIPKLLDMLVVEGAIITIDAMGCQRAIARKIIEKKADYVFGLKGNQGSPREDVELMVTERKARDFVDSEIRQATTIDADHGRIETRTTTVIHDVEWLRNRHDWPGLKAVVMVESTREIAGKAEQETRFYITSPVMPAHLLGPVVRSHWAIETSPHWVMDMIFRDDECQVRTNHAQPTAPPSNTWRIICSADPPVGRRVPHEPHCGMMFSPDSPAPGIRPDERWTDPNEQSTTVDLTETGPRYQLRHITVSCMIRIILPSESKLFPRLQSGNLPDGIGRNGNSSTHGCHRRRCDKAHCPGIRAFAANT
jgi:predicted transposase YbfD/YdcC